MATFKSSKLIITDLKDLTEVAAYTKEYFTTQGYTVEVEESSFGFFISLTKGGMFKAVLGMKTALNIDIKSVGRGVAIDAKVGIFGQQLVPSLIMLFVAWPVLLSQIWGLVSQSKLDDEAIQVIEQAIHLYENPERINAAKEGMDNSIFCTECGLNLPLGAKFCLACGKQVAAPPGNVAF